MNFCPHCGHNLKEKKIETNDDNVIEELSKDPELKKILVEALLSS